MKNFIVTLRNNNCIVEIIGQFRTKWECICFIEDNYIEFYKDVCQYSKWDSPFFIKIDRP